MILFYYIRDKKGERMILRGGKIEMFGIGLAGFIKTGSGKSAEVFQSKNERAK